MGGPRLQGAPERLCDAAVRPSAASSDCALGAAERSGMPSYAASPSRRMGLTVTALGTASASLRSICAPQQARPRQSGTPDQTGHPKLAPCSRQHAITLRLAGRSFELRTSRSMTTGMKVRARRYHLRSV